MDILDHHENSGLPASMSKPLINMRSAIRTMTTFRTFANGSGTPIYPIAQFNTQKMTPAMTIHTNAASNVCPEISASTGNMGHVNAA